MREVELLDGQTGAPHGQREELAPLPAEGAHHIAAHVEEAQQRDGGLLQRAEQQAEPRSVDQIPAEDELLQQRRAFLLDPEVERAEDLAGEEQSLEVEHGQAAIGRSVEPLQELREALGDLGVVSDVQDGEHVREAALDEEAQRVQLDERQSALVELQHGEQRTDALGEAAKPHGERSAARLLVVGERDSADIGAEERGERLGEGVDGVEGESVFGEVDLTEIAEKPALRGVGDADQRAVGELRVAEMEIREGTRVVLLVPRPERVEEVLVAFRRDGAFVRSN